MLCDRWQKGDFYQKPRLRSTRIQTELWWSIRKVKLKVRANPQSCILAYHEIYYGIESIRVHMQSKNRCCFLALTLRRCECVAGFHAFLQHRPKGGIVAIKHGLYCIDPCVRERKFDTLVKYFSNRFGYYKLVVIRVWEGGKGVGTYSCELWYLSVAAAAALHTLFWEDVD